MTIDKSESRLKLKATYHNSICNETLSDQHRALDRYSIDRYKVLHQHIDYQVNSRTIQLGRHPEKCKLTKNERETMVRNMEI